MSKNIFLEKNQFVPNPKRNAYDMSKLVNGTYRSGFIYPVDWTEVTFGDSVRLDYSAALRTMPMVWPIQTPILAKFYTFYVRYRTLQKDYADMRFNNKQVTIPFIALPRDADFWKTGELGDHLGIPTTLATDESLNNDLLFIPPNIQGLTPHDYPVLYFINEPIQLLMQSSYTIISTERADPELVTFPWRCRFFGRPFTLTTLKNLDTSRQYLYFPKRFLTSSVVNNNFGLGVAVFRTGPNIDGYQLFGDFAVQYRYIDTNTFPQHLGLPLNRNSFSILTGDTYSSFSNFLDNYEDPAEGINYYFCIYQTNNDDIPVGKLSVDTIASSDVELPADQLFYPTIAKIEELSDVGNPFSGSNPTIPLCSYLPRAYEAIYRSYFQDLVNEPFMIDGVAQYNRYITNDGNGADYTDYKLFRRNWEADFLTSCKPSPQQGLAPIVGITSSGDITLIKGDGDEYTVHVNTNNDDVIESIDFASQSSPSDSSVRRTLLELASSGITINSLRNTNSLQQWLEANYRRGLKLRDQVLSNFGVKLEYKELDMPEFLGGFTIPLNVDTINQTSSSVQGSPLGEIAGNGGFFGKAKHSISHYCDEEGVVMTLMCITPIPVYSQILNRSWLKSNPLDFYNPQFGKIGNQPVTYEEVCPVQAFNEGFDVHDVFGYQRPWYHLISAVDEVHGLMRSDMSGFLMQRIFGSTPELGADFLHIDESQMNEVFVVRDEKEDTFYGQIGVKKYKKTCIPRYSVPSLS